MYNLLTQKEIPIIFRLMNQGAQSVGGTQANGFASTNWSLVLSAARNEDGGEALDRLCRRYWKAIYIYARRGGLSPADAEDATQDFFVYILERSWLKQADEKRGSFRGFLFALLRNFLGNRRRHETAQKRGGWLKFEPADLAELEQVAAADTDPSMAYERTWAACVARVALERLGREQENAGNTARFKELGKYLTHPPEAADYERVARSLVEPRHRLEVYLHRLTRRYGELVRAEVLDTVADPSDVEPELRRLVEVLSCPG